MNSPATSRQKDTDGERVGLGGTTQTDEKSQEGAAESCGFLSDADLR